MVGMVLVQIIWIDVIHSVAFLDQALGMLIQLNWVVITYNFNIVNRMLIINESSRGAFLLTTLYVIYLVITFACHLFPALTEYQP
jgi:hypothetical protein